MERKQKKKIYRRRRIVICLFLFLASCAIVSGIRRFSDMSAVPAARKGGDSSLSYTMIVKKAEDIHRGNLILVNNRIPYTFPENNRLRSVYDMKNSSYQVKDKDVLLEEQMIPPLNQMLEDFQKKKGANDLIVISGYRTKQYQAELLQQRTKEDGAAEAAKWVAQPGGSEHHTGYALDFGIYTRSGKSEDYTAQGKYSWINENSWKYGFIVRYPSDKTDLTGILYEPWHFRYVGIPHAAVIREKGLCLEEYMDYLRQFPYDGEHLQVTAQVKNYEIYYVKADGKKTKVPVPENKDYSLSGNNTDGFIVTIVR